MHDLSDSNIWKLEADAGNVTDFTDFLESSREQDAMVAVHSILGQAVTKYAEANNLKNVEYDQNYVSIARVSSNQYFVTYGENTFQLKRIAT